MLVKRFVNTAEDGTEQNIWVKERADGNGEVVSAAAHCTEEIFNPVTGFVQVEKFMFWIKGSTVDIVERNLKAILAQISKGIYVPYRIFSAEPLHEKHLPDVNPSTGEPIDRYSQVRLGTAEQARTLHRTYIELPVSTTVTTEQTTAKVAVETGAEEK